MEIDDKNIREAANAEVSALKNIFEATEKEEIRRGCKAAFELFKGYMEAGFDKNQAFALVIAFMQTAIRQQNNNGSDRR